MASSKKTYRLGERADREASRKADALSLTDADTLRVAIFKLDVDQVLEEKAAYDAATKLKASLADEFGPWTQLRLRAGKPLRVLSRGGEHDVTGARTEGRETEHGLALDLHIDDDGRDLYIVAVLVGVGEEAFMPLVALHLAPVIPPARREITRDGIDGPETVVWTEDGKQLTYVGGKLRPNRVARFL
jgi:hypothetical protein